MELPLEIWSVTSTETSSNKALHTIKEFKIHNLKSNEDEE